MDAYEILYTLTAAAGPSGRERVVADAAASFLTPLSTKTDALGNLLAVVKDGGGKHIVLEAHMDQIGFVVTAVSEDGFVKISPVGGVDEKLMPASKLVIYGKKPVKAVVCATPPHLLSGEEKAAKFDDLWVDTGKAEGISVGDHAVFAPGFTVLSGGVVSGVGLDDKAGIAALIVCADRLKELKNDVKVTLLFTTQEEVGERGAAVACFTAPPDEVISVDVSFGRAPGVPKHKSGDFGAGPMIGVSSTLNKEVTARLIETAEKKDIPFQREIMAGKTSTNADVLGLTAGGIKTGLVSVPLKFMHSPRELICVEDIGHTANLLYHYIEASGGEQDV